MLQGLDGMAHHGPSLPIELGWPDAPVRLSVAWAQCWSACWRRGVQFCPELVEFGLGPALRARHGWLRVFCYQLGWLRARVNLLHDVCGLATHNRDLACHGLYGPGLNEASELHRKLPADLPPCYASCWVLYNLEGSGHFAAGLAAVVRLTKDLLLAGCRQAVYLW